jgi:GxxExxY protein
LNFVRPPAPAQAADLLVVRQHGGGVYYQDVVVGDYVVDVLVGGLLLVALETVEALDGAQRMQCINYLKATDMQLCLLLDFGKPRLEIKRVAHGL